MVLLPILIASILVPGLAPLFAVLLAVALLLALLEFWIIAGKQQIRADPVAGFLGAAALFTIFYFADPREAVDFSAVVAVLILLTICSLVAAMLRGAPFERKLAGF